MHSRHILPLTGIRLFAAGWVVLCHVHGIVLMLFPEIPPGIRYFIGSVCAQGFEAVPLFFILSGFILSHNYFSDYSLSWHPKFIFLRFARLWPVHVVALVLMAGGPALLHLNRASFVSLVEELLMVRSWFHSDLEWNYPAWSISAEWFAYIFVFPLAFYGFKRIQSRWLLGAIVALALGLHSFLPQTLLPGRVEGIFFLFLMGSALYRLFCLVKNPPAEAITIAGALLMLSYMLWAKYLNHVVLYTAFALLVYGLAYERGFLAKFLSTKAVVLGGLISYSLYMTHVLVLRDYQLFFWNNLPHALFLRCMVVLVLAAALVGTAAVFYYFVEEPCNKRLRSWMANVSVARPKLPVALSHQTAIGKNREA